MSFSAPWHPQVVHFAIALFIVYVFLELIGTIFKKDFFSKSAHLILLLGVLAGLAAVFTGNQAFDIANKLKDHGVNIPVKAINNHEDAANLVVWYFTILLVIRTFLVLKKKFTGYIKYIIVILALTGAILVYRAGALGGELVYKYGVGTDLIKHEITNHKDSPNL